MTMTTGLTHWLDVLIIVVYFCILICVGLWTLFRRKKSNVQQYFLAGRSMSWFAVGSSLFSSNIGSEHFVGLAGAGAAAGIALVLYEWLPIFLILMLGWLFIPVYVSAGVYTLPEYINKRHGGRRIRIYMSCVALVLYVITKLAASMFSGVLFIHIALRWDMYAALVVLLAVTGIYTVLGGLTAVMYTDTFQTVIMVLGSATVMVLGFVKIGGYGNLERLYMAAVPSVRANNASNCGLPRADAFSVFQDPLGGDQPWPGLVLQASLGCLWYWCCDQVIVQRSLAARSLSHAKGGSLLAGALKILPLFLLIFPGMISRILFPDEVACSAPDVCLEVCDNPAGCSNIAYPKLVLELLPLGARGLLLAVMLSAIMSSLTSIFNSASTVFTMDLWHSFRPDAKQRELLIVGRLFVVIMCVVAALWIPMVKAFQSGRLFSYMVAVEGYIGSPIGVLFLLSIFWRGTTETGAFFGIILGHVVGTMRLMLELIYPAPTCGEEDLRITFLSKLHFSYFVQLQLLFTAVMIVAISLCSQRRTNQELEGLTWWSRHKPRRTGAVLNVDVELQIKSPRSTHDKLLSGLLTSNEESLHVDESGCKVQESAPDCATRWFQMVCGVTVDNQDEEKLDMVHICRFLRQSKSASRLLNVAAVFLMAIVAFITGFYH